jgi:UDP-perosamine 4-acetyltransferase
MRWPGRSNAAEARAMTQRLLIVGAGGHAKVVIETTRAAGFVPVAAVDPHAQGDVLGVPVRGADADIARLWAAGEFDAAAVAVGDNALRQRLAAMIRRIGCPTPTIIHPRATVSPTAEIGDGVVIMAHAAVNASARIGRDGIVNTAAVVEHDCRLGEAVHAAPRSVMGGSCSFGSLTLFGIGAVARPGVKVGSRVVIGAGATVVRDIPDGWVAAGTPAKRIRPEQNAQERSRSSV